MDRLAPPELPAWLDRLVPFERFRVRVGGGHLHVNTAGPEDAPPVLLLHGNPTWGFLWRKVAAELSGERLRLVMPDLLGLGFSNKPRDPAVHTLENHARWIGELVDGLADEGGWDRLVFVGHDWGGPIGLRMLADRPRLLAGLVILNTVASPPRPGFRPTAFHRFARAPLVSTLAFRGLSFPQRALHRAQGDRDSIRGEVARAYRYPLRGWSRNAAPLALARMVPDSMDHPSIPGLDRCREMVESFDGPAAIVWGDRDPILGRVRRWMEILLPEAEVTRTKAGHFLQEEVPEEIAAAVRSVAGRAFSAG
ncbi:MAG: alpha/beta fold hydrolase [Thermoanaerobaculia bacterium]